MLYQYHCGCCDKVVTSTAKKCPYCGSRSIRSPWGWSVFCLFACLIVVAMTKIVPFYADQQVEQPHPVALGNLLSKQ